METVTVYDGKQSAPLFYDNTAASLSEVTVNTDELPIGRNWSIGSPQTLVLWVYGDPDNATTEQLYLKIGNTKVLYDGNISEPTWRQWNIDLVALGINLSNVAQLAIGFERTGVTGGSGMVLVDEIRLYREAPLLPEAIWIEVEAATTIEAPMRIFNDPSASGGKYIMKDPTAAESFDEPPTDGLVTYTFTVAGGTYKVAGRVISNGGNDSFWVRIPSATTQTTNHASGWVMWAGLSQEVVWGWEDVFSENDVVVRITLTKNSRL